MPTIHTLLDARPPARTDDVPWNRARIEQSATETGSFTTTTTITLDPLDSDPEVPDPRDFTFQSSLEEGWFRIVWLDESDLTSPPTDPVFDDGTGVAWRPTTLDVEAMIRARGPFTSTSRPTAEQVEDLINRAVDEIAGRIGGFDVISDSNRALARELAAIRAAMSVELGYYPEQTNTDRSAFENLRQLYEDALEGLRGAIPDSDATRKGIYSIETRSAMLGAVEVGELLP